MRALGYFMRGLEGDNLWLTLRVRVVNTDISVKRPGSRCHIETQWRRGPDCGENHQRPAGKC